MTGVHVTSSPVELLSDLTLNESERNINKVYCTQESCPKSDSTFRLLSSNIRSYRSNVEPLHELIADTNPSLYALQEVWQDPPPPPKDYVSEHSLRKHSRGGGVGFLIHKSLDYELVDSPFIPKKIETICIKFDISSHKRYICLNVYIGFTDKLTSLHHVNACIHKLKATYKNYDIICVGDFNTNLIENSSHSNELKNGMSVNNLLPVITVPTRIAKINNTISHSCIDNIFITHDIRNKSNVVCTSISDHMTVLLDIPLFNKRKVKEKKFLYKEVRQYPDSAIDKLKNDLLQYDLSLLRSLSANKSAESFIDWLNNKIDQYCPVKTIKVKNHKPWFTKGLSVSKRNLSKLCLKQLRNPCFYTINKYNEYKKLYRKLLRESKIRHYKIQFQKHELSSRKQWSLVNELCDKRTFRDLPDRIRINGTLVSNKKDLADYFNKNFAEMGKKIAENFEDNKDYKMSLKNHQLKSSLKLLKINNTQTQQLINDLIPKQSHGHDLCTNRLLKQLKAEISPIITILINNSVRDSTYPKIFKLSRVLPLYKAGKMTEPSNYRPISLGSSISKLLEKHIKKQLNNYLTQESILPKNQFGFRQRTRTSNLLHKVVQETIERSENKLYSRLLLIDYSKAFDCVDISLLIRKLRVIGLEEPFIKWFQTYLNGRTQYTEYNGILSDKINITHGVPQGSVLGPLLFLIYTFDIKFISEDDTFQFADDTSLLVSGKTEAECIEKSVRLLNKFYDWSSNNKLSINIKKTKLMSFNFDYKEPLLLKGISVEKVTSYKLLGIIIDNKLSWNDHVDKLCTKLKASLYNLSRLKKTMDLKLKMLIMKGIFMSHLNYGIEIWGGTSQTNIKRLQIMQKKAIRKVFNQPPSSHTVTLFQSAGIPTVQQLIEISTLNYTKSCRSLNAPDNVKALYQTRTSNRSTRSACTDTVDIPYTNKQYVLNQIQIRSGNLWNNYPDEIKSLERRKFKTKTKDFVMNKYTE